MSTSRVKNGKTVPISIDRFLGHASLQCGVANKTQAGGRCNENILSGWVNTPYFIQI